MLNRLRLGSIGIRKRGFASKRKRFVYPNRTFAVETYPSTIPFQSATSYPADIWPYIEARLPAGITWVTCNPATSTGNADQASKPLRGFFLGPADGPVLMITGGMHGNEAAATPALCEFVKRVHTPTGPNAAIYTEFQQFRLSVLPCLNPAGRSSSGSYPYGSRKLPSQLGTPWNPPRGVDPNRTYPHRWDEPNDWYHTDPEGSWYKGTAPAQDPETQAVMNWTTANPPYFHMDVHTDDGNEQRVAMDNGIGTAYEDWHADRTTEVYALYPSYNKGYWQTSHLPGLFGWMSNRKAPDGEYVMSQMPDPGRFWPPEAGAVANPHEIEANMILTTMVVVAARFYDEAKARGLF